MAGMIPSFAWADEGSQIRPLEERAASASVLPQGTSSSSNFTVDTFALSEENDRVTGEGISFGITDFMRYNKGTNKDFEGQYFGYRFPAASENAFSVVVAQGYTIVYMPEHTVQGLGYEISDGSFQQDFIALLEHIDEAASLGGAILVERNQPYYFTQEESILVEGYLYCFDLELGEGGYYTSVSELGTNDGSSGALYSETGTLAPTQSISIAAPLTGFDSFVHFLANLDFRPLWVSLKTSGVALIFIFLLGLLAAWATIKASNRFKGIFDTVFTIPMVLPPTVCGFLLLMFFGTSTDVGRWLIEHGIDIVFTWPAAVIACIVVGFPLMYRTTRGAFENLDPTMLDAARTLGWSEPRIFVSLMLPLAWPSIAAGTVLAFARAMGEFGATLFFAGNYAGITQTIPLAIYFQWMGGNTDVAIFWVIVVIIISFFFILLINMYSSRTQRYRKAARHELEG